MRNYELRTINRDDEFIGFILTAVFLMFFIYGFAVSTIHTYPEPEPIRTLGLNIRSLE